VPVASPLPLSDISAAVAMETAGVRPSAATDGDPALTPAEGEARVAAESVTELIVSTQPEGARVTVNGIGWGTAPVTIRYRPGGHKRIRVTRFIYMWVRLTRVDNCYRKGLFPEPLTTRSRQARIGSRAARVNAAICWENRQLDDFRDGRCFAHKQTSAEFRETAGEIEVVK
jgi:hypothetical protein